MLKLSLERETGGGTVGLPTEENFLPLSGRNTNLQFYDTLRFTKKTSFSLQSKTESPQKKKKKM